MVKKQKLNKNSLASGTYLLLLNMAAFVLGGLEFQVIPGCKVKNVNLFNNLPAIISNCDDGDKRTFVYTLDLTLKASSLAFSALYDKIDVDAATNGSTSLLGSYNDDYKRIEVQADFSSGGATTALTGLGGLTQCARKLGNTYCLCSDNQDVERLDESDFNGVKPTFTFTSKSKLMALQIGTTKGFSVDGGAQKGVLYDYSLAPASAELVYLQWASMDKITSILAPNSPSFYLMATDSSKAIKISPINLTLQSQSQMNVLFKDIYSLITISDTTLVAFGTKETYVGILDYQTMIDTTYTLLDDKIEKIIEIPGTRLLVATVVSQEYFQVLSFVQKNPKFCKTFKNYYQFECVSCLSNRNLHLEECILSCPATYYPKDYGTPPVEEWRCEQCPVGCSVCSEIAHILVCQDPTPSAPEPEPTPQQPNTELKIRSIDVHPLKQTITYSFGNSLAKDCLEFLDFKFSSTVTEQDIKIVSVSIADDSYIVVQVDATEDIETQLEVTPKTGFSKIFSLDGKRWYSDFPITKKIVIIHPKVFTQATVKSSNTALFSFVGVLGVISFQSVALIIKLIQMFDIFVLLNIPKPSNLEAFLGIFDLDMFKMIPNLFASDFEEEHCQINRFLKENNIQCLLLNNSGQLLTYLFAMAMMKGLLLILAATETLIKTATKPAAQVKGRNEKNPKNPKNEESLMQRISQKMFLFGWLNEKFGIVFILDVSNALSLDIFIGSWPVLTFIGNFWSTKIWISLAILLGMLLYYLGVCGTYLIAAIRYIGRSEVAEIPKIFGVYQTEAKFGLFYVQIVLIRDILTPAFLIFGAGSPYIQLIPLILFSLLVLVFLIATSPFSSKVENIIQIALSSIYVIILALMVLLYELKDSLDEDIKYNYLGNTIIGLLGLSLLINIMFSIFGVFFTIKDFFIKKKQSDAQEPKRNGIEKIHPEIPDSHIDRSHQKVSLRKKVSIFENNQKRLNVKSVQKSSNRGLKKIAIDRNTILSPKKFKKSNHGDNRSFKYARERDPMGYNKFMKDRLRNNKTVDSKAVSLFHLSSVMASRNKLSTKREIEKEEKKQENKNKIKKIPKEEFIL